MSSMTTLHRFRFACAGMIASAAVLTLTACNQPAQSQQAIDASARYADVARALEQMIRHEMSDKELQAVSIALVDNQQIVWAKGFGHARPDSTPATATTVHRVGSVSKLFTDIGIMQLVERGQIDLDAPVAKYLPDFAVANTSGTTITLRQLMSHRSGLQREPAVGNYFTEDAPTLAATVASLKGRDLVYPPGTRTKYSNAGIAVVGRVLESLKQRPFAEYLHDAVLVPLGLERTAFEPTSYVRENLAVGHMWTWDGRTFEAPTFQLGMSPAGSMYASVLDLGRFLTVLFAGGTGPNGQVLKRQTLETMWTPQFAAAGARTGFGIGFSVDELDGRRRIGHGGAIYGFATDVAALPDEKLGAVVVITTDVTNTVAERISDTALQLMLAVKEGKPLPAPRTPQALPAERVRALAGHYENPRRAIDLVARNDQLEIRMPTHHKLRAFGDTLVIDDRLLFGTRLLPITGNRMVVGTDTLVRRSVPKPAVPPAEWLGLIGEYGWDHNTLYIYEDGGKLYANIEWFFPYEITQESPNVFAFPKRGLYDGENLIFTRDANGRATRVEAAGVVFERRNIGTEAGETFRIRPLRPVEELRAAALAGSPPKETGDFLDTDLVELRSIDPTIRYDIRYATTNNFMSAAFYTQAKAFLQRPAAEAVARANQRLRKQGYGLLIHDAYRPWYVTKMFWDATPPNLRHFVADPSRGSRHNRGAAIDLTIFELSTGNVVEMVGGYDEFSDRSYADYVGGTSRQRWLRELLRTAMEAEGFEVYEWEWWHFDYRDWRKYRIGNHRFEQLATAR